MTYPEFLWADQYKNWTREDLKMVVQSRVIFKICASRYSKNALCGSVCSYISLQNIF